jgi:type VI protein secretion system component VasK
MRSKLFIRWGLDGLRGVEVGAVATSLASAIIWAYERHRPGRQFAPFELHSGVIVVVFLAVALCTNIVAGRARSREIEADQRRREAESVTANLAEQQAALRRVATLVARGVDPPSWTPQWTRKCSTTCT